VADQELVVAEARVRNSAVPAATARTSAVRAPPMMASGTRDARPNRLVSGSPRSTAISVRARHKTEH
jgi:hypothetical protein